MGKSREKAQKTRVYALFLFTSPAPSLMIEVDQDPWLKECTGESLFDGAYAAGATLA